MSTISTLYDTVEICCPHCDYFNEFTDLDVSITVENTDCGRPIAECVFVHDCDDCGKQFKIKPRLDITLEKI